MIKRLLISLFLTLTCLVTMVMPASASSIAMSGNFYMVDLQVKQGQTVTYPEAYVVIFNYNNYPLNYKIETTQPNGVTMKLSQYTGTITAMTGECPTYVFIYLQSITVGKRVKVGDYPVSILATMTNTGGNILGGVEMSNVLTVLSHKTTKTNYLKRYFKRNN